jgi:hypothetical protein
MYEPGLKAEICVQGCHCDIVSVGDRVSMDLGRLRIGENEMAVDALKVALQQLEVGIVNRQVSIRSIRLGKLHDAISTLLAFGNSVVDIGRF